MAVQRSHTASTLGDPRRLYLLILFLLTIHFNVSAQEKQLVQIKTFDHNLQVMRNIELSVNDRPYLSVGAKGVAMLELNAGEAIRSVKIKDEKLEAASWNFSKGTVEIIIRPKSYTITQLTLTFPDGTPLAKTPIVFKGTKPISVTTDQEGRFEIPLALNETIRSADQFVVAGHYVSKLNVSSGILTLERPVVEAKSEPLPKVRPVFDLSRLDSIRSLNRFYAIFRALPISDLDEESRAKVDIRFRQLVTLHDDSIASRSTPTLVPNISDSSAIAADVHNLLNYIGIETQIVENNRADFDEKIKIISSKLERGVSNLTEQEKQLLLQDIDKLEELLARNESKFNKNQQDYREIIDALRSKYFDIEELQTRLSLAEQQRLEEQKLFNQRMVVGGIVLIVFAIMIILLIRFSGRMRSQAKELKAANEEVRTINENLEAIVVRRTQLLEESNRELDTFLYRASHDLRSPLRSILGLVNIKDHIPAPELIDRVTHTVGDMDVMLKKLISVSEIKRESEKLQDINISAIVENVKQRFDELIRQHNVQVHIVCPTDLTFRSNAVLIDCIVSNLMQNAILFSALKSADHARVEVTARRDNGSLNLTIYDNGVGIDESIRPHLFNMFFTGHEKSKGNGLGLYMVSKCVSVLFGTITLESEPNRYTKFSISLPTTP
jgi:signal transduction histidine kinase